MNNKIGIKSVKFTPICTSGEMTLEVKIPTSNEVVQKMWNKLNDNEKKLVNWLIDKANRSDKAIEYIEEQSKFIEGCDIYKICNKDVLLGILKGSDKE